MSSALTEFINLLVGGITEMAQGIGAGLNAAVSDMFLATDATTHAVTGLSTFGGVVAIFRSESGPSSRLNTINFPLGAVSIGK